MTFYASTCQLADRGVIRLSGAGTRAFLQGLVTCDMDRVTPDTAAYGALLSPQGKILSDFFIVENGDGFMMDAPLALTADLAKRLSFYRLRAKIIIEIESGGLSLDTQSDNDMTLAASWGEDPALPGAVAGFADPRAPVLGTRSIAPRRVTQGLPGYESAYEARRIEAGVPRGGADFAYGETFPHEANLDRLHGVDFAKGCFIGQEVVARVEHRGTARKRVARVTFKGPLLAPGTKVMAGETEIGSIGSSYFGHALAMLRLDKAADALAAGQALMAGDVRLALVGDAGKTGGAA